MQLLSQVRGRMHCSPPGSSVPGQCGVGAGWQAHPVTHCPGPTWGGTLWLKAQHEGALPPPCIVRKDPRVPHIAQLVKNPFAVQGTSVQFLGREDLLEMAEVAESKNLQRRLSQYPGGKLIRD